MPPSRDNLTLTDRELAYRLGWFTHVRWGMGAGALLLLLVSWYVLGIRFNAVGREPSIAPAAKIVMLIFLYNAAFAFLVHVLRARSAMTRLRIVLLALGQLLCDIFAVCALVHSTGGAENLFMILILLPLVIATELLPRSLAYAVAGIAAIMLNAMAWGQQQGLLEHVHAHWPDGAAYDACRYADGLYVLEVTGAMTIMMFVTVFVASAISQRLRQREAELEEAHGRLSATDQTKSFFMRKAGHEMRAPLAAIQNILQAVAGVAGPLTAEHHRLLDRACLRTGALMDLVQDLRRYSRLKSPDGILDIERVSFSDLVLATTELFRQQARNQDIIVNCSAPTVWLNGDEEMLRELVTNLISNAVQYTPAGGQIDVDVRSRRGSIEFTVADTGIGISEQAGLKLFQDFYRSPEAKQMLPEGTGLGLAITKRIVEMHGGQIEFESRQTGGTVFKVTLPRKRSEGKALPPAPSP